MQYYAQRHMCMINVFYRHDVTTRSSVHGLDAQFAIAIHVRTVLYTRTILYYSGGGGGGDGRMDAF